MPCRFLLLGPVGAFFPDGHWSALLDVNIGRPAEPVRGHAARLAYDEMRTTL
ncbi:hypothetical protein [Streptomyces capillispiralis]|uniref:hypothetical protein n=1 Tax=Streptomyces capillispiralis TaxID=68182 RepID=UPI00142EDF28|nr:hypothetical protein [Streptomyces capillispiralis]